VTGGIIVVSRSEREAAANLAERIEASLVDPSKEDEAHRPAGDRSPGYADVLMSEAATPIERAFDLSSADWELVAKALQHYAGCGN
jgi:hypothetical protein